MNRVSPNTKANQLLAAVIGRRVRLLRVRIGISQAKLSEWSGISQAEVSQIENGHRTASVGTLFCLADGLGVDVSELLY